jgi:hypothetical protein
MKQILLPLLSDGKLWVERGGFKVDASSLPTWPSCIFFLSVVNCWLLGVGCVCQVLVVVVVVGCWLWLWLSGVGFGCGCRVYLSMVVLCYWMSGDVSRLLTGCQGVAVGDCCWSLVVVYRLSGVGC